MAFLSAETLGFSDSDAGHSNFVQRFLHFIEFERLDDRFDLLHGNKIPRMRTPDGANPCPFILMPRKCPIKNRARGEECALGDAKSAEKSEKSTSSPEK
jgi:hypothetical protein